MGVVIGQGGSDDSQPQRGTLEAARRVRKQLGGATADVVLVFLAGGHLAASSETLAVIGDVLEPGALVGVAASAVLANGGQLVGRSTVAIWAARLGGGSATVVEAPAGRDVPPLAQNDVDAATAVILLPDRRSFPIWQRLDEVSGLLQGVPVLGGCASAHLPDDEPTLFVGERPARGGLLAVVLRDVEVLPVVAMGQVPVGRELVVSAADRHVVHELSGRPAVTALQEALDALAPEERQLLDGGVGLGLVHDGQSAGWSARKILSTDAVTGAIAIGSTVDRGQGVRLLANSRIEAERALRDGLRLAGRALGGKPPAGTLVFACTSRDVAFFGHDGHDAAIVAEAFPSSPSAGLVSQGEIGPVEGAARALALATVVAVMPA
jgi:small ligand-binding sensory domain FIST